jgi:hypothetical protein
VSSLSVFANKRERASANLLRGPGMCWPCNWKLLSITRSAKWHEMARSTGFVSELKLLLCSQHRHEELSVMASTLPSCGIASCSTSIHRPTTEAKYSMELFGIGSFESNAYRQARPDGIATPPIPVGQASVMVIVVGRRVDKRLRLMPSAAFSRKRFQVLSVLSSMAPSLMVRHLV